MRHPSISESESEKIKRILGQELSGARNLRDRINDDFAEHRVQNLYQQREPCRHITIISAAVLGLSPLGIEKVADGRLFSLGIFAHVLVIAFSLVYLHGILNKDARGLAEHQEGYTRLMHQKIKLIERFIYLPILTEEHYLRYRQELESQPDVQRLKQRYEDIVGDKTRKMLPDYFLPLIIFLFIIASLTTLLGISGLQHFA